MNNYLNTGINLEVVRYKKFLQLLRGRFKIKPSQFCMNKMSFFCKKERKNLLIKCGVRFHCAKFTSTFNLCENYFCFGRFVVKNWQKVAVRGKLCIKEHNNSQFQPSCLLCIETELTFYAVVSQKNSKLRHCIERVECISLG